MIEAILTNIIILYIFYKYLMRIMFNQFNKIKEEVGTLNHVMDESNENHFKNIYLKQKIEYILMCMKEERKELKEKTEDLYKLIVEYEKFEEKEKEYIQVNQDKETEIEYLKEKNKKLFKIIFKFLVSFEKEIDEYRNREDAYKIREKKYINDREEFKFLSLE